MLFDREEARTTKVLNGWRGSEWSARRNMVEWDFVSLKHST